MNKWEQEFEEKLREKLSESPAGFDPAAWEKMERRLYPAVTATRPLSRWWLRAAAAVIFLSGVGIWAYTAYFSPSGDLQPTVSDSQPAVRAPSAGEQPAAGKTGPPAAKEQQQQPASSAAEKARQAEIRNLAEKPVQSEAVDRREEAGLAVIDIDPARPEIRQPALPELVPPTGALRSGGASAPAGEKMSLSLGVIAAPDLNGVGGFKNSEPGINLGFSVGLHFNERLSLHSGIVYSRKPYNALPSDYHTRYSPQGLANVAAICDVIDIPLDLRYTIYRRGSNSISLSAGLSSYLMLREHYEYQYYAEAARTYEYKNENRHFMGIGNLGLSLERKISDNMSIGVQPFIKVPLGGIGHGKVRLISAGAALRLNVNLSGKRDSQIRVHDE